MANPYDEGQHPLGHAVWRALAEAAATSGGLTVAGLMERLKAHPSAAVAKITKGKLKSHLQQGAMDNTYASKGSDTYALSQFQLRALAAEQAPLPPPAPVAAGPDKSSRPAKVDTGVGAAEAQPASRLAQLSLVPPPAGTRMRAYWAEDRRWYTGAVGSVRTTKFTMFYDVTENDLVDAVVDDVVKQQTEEVMWPLDTNPTIFQLLDVPCQLPPDIARASSGPKNNKSYAFAQAVSPDGTEERLRPGDWVVLTPPPAQGPSAHSYNDAVWATAVPAAQAGNPAKLVAVRRVGADTSRQSVADVLLSRLWAGEGGGDGKTAIALLPDLVTLPLSCVAGRVGVLQGSEEPTPLEGSQESGGVLLLPPPTAAHVCVGVATGADACEPLLAFCQRNNLAATTVQAVPRQREVLEPPEKIAIRADLHLKGVPDDVMKAELARLKAGPNRRASGAELTSGRGGGRGGAAKAQQPKAAPKPQAKPKAAPVPPKAKKAKAAPAEEVAPAPPPPPPLPPAPTPAPAPPPPKKRGRPPKASPAKAPAPPPVAESPPEEEKEEEEEAVEEEQPARGRAGPQRGRGRGRGRGGRGASPGRSRGRGRGRGRGTKRKAASDGDDDKSADGGEEATDGSDGEQPAVEAPPAKPEAVHQPEPAADVVMQDAAPVERAPALAPEPEPVAAAVPVAQTPGPPDVPALAAPAAPAAPLRSAFVIPKRAVTAVAAAAPPPVDETPQPPAPKPTEAGAGAGGTARLAEQSKLQELQRAEYEKERRRKFDEATTAAKPRIAPMAPPPGPPPPRAAQPHQGATPLSPPPQPLPPPPAIPGLGPPRHMGVQQQVQMPLAAPLPMAPMAVPPRPASPPLVPSPLRHSAVPWESALKPLVTGSTRSVFDGEELPATITVDDLARRYSAWPTDTWLGPLPVPGITDVLGLFAPPQGDSAALHPPPGMHHRAGSGAAGAGSLPYSPPHEQMPFFPPPAVPEAYGHGGGGGARMPLPPPRPPPRHLVDDRGRGYPSTGHEDRFRGREPERERGAHPGDGRPKKRDRTASPSPEQLAQRVGQEQQQQQV